MAITNEDLDRAVQRFMSSLEPPGGFVTKWFLVAEGLGPEGGRYMQTVWTEGLTTWDVRGLLHEALATQLVGQVTDSVVEGED